MQPNPALLVKHQYDALNRLVASTPSTLAASQRFYLKDRLVTEIQGKEQRSIMQHEDQLLAQQQHQSGIVETRLLATDPQRSVLNVLDATRPHSLVYTPYGHRTIGNGLLSLLGFNGERPDPMTGWYLLGTGYHRPFNPVLMCFTSPDSWSPFGEGGLNAYSYCKGDPINLADNTGHMSWPALMAKHFPKATLAAKKTNPGTPLGLFEKIQGAPHITEKIINLLPSKDLGSLASSSKPLKKTINTLSDNKLTRLLPVQGGPDLDRIFTPAMQGEVQGILPYRAIVTFNVIQENLNNYQRTMNELMNKSLKGPPTFSLKRIRTK